MIDVQDDPSLDVAIFSQIAGVDEVGRGCLAGPVIAAAVIFTSPQPPERWVDSKSISKSKREELAAYLPEIALIGFGQVEAAEIDQINIRQASIKAMQLAVANLPHMPPQILVDGRDVITLPETDIAVTAIIKGDSKIAAIAAASIAAKVYRDGLMTAYHQQYPQYGFASNAGYGSKTHLQALQHYGPTPIHRRSFKPVTAMLGVGEP